MNSSKWIKYLILSYNSAGTTLNPLLLPSEQFLLNHMQFGVWPEQKQWVIHAHCETFLLLLDWDTSTPNAVKLVLQKVTKELLLHDRRMLISLRLICAHFKLKFAHARDSSNFRHYKSNVFVFPHSGRHSAAHRGQALRYPGQAGVRGDRTQSRFPPQRTPGKGMDWVL